MDFVALHDTNCKLTKTLQVKIHLLFIYHLMINNNIFPKFWVAVWTETWFVWASLNVHSSSYRSVNNTETQYLGGSWVSVALAHCVDFYHSWPWNIFLLWVHSVCVTVSKNSLLVMKLQLRYLYLIAFMRTSIIKLYIHAWLHHAFLTWFVACSYSMWAMVWFTVHWGGHPIIFDRKLEKSCSSRC